MAKTFPNLANNTQKQKDEQIQWIVKKRSCDE